MEWFLLLPAILGLLFWWGIRRMRRNIFGSHAEKILREWHSIEQIADTHRRVLEADKILESALTMLGYAGTMSEKLKKAGARLPGLKAVWAAHKLRNRIAHETDIRVTEADATTALRAFERALRSLIT